MYSRFFVVIICALVPYLVHAATSDFSVRSVVGEDVAPPTTPTLLSAEAVASSQIDLEWTPSTDDFELSGYSVLRDGLPIATTTLTTYSDTGLTASTTYEYTIRAFDWLFNFSSTSNALATTTLAAPAPPPSATTSTSTRTGATASGKLMLRGGVEISTHLTSATFVWETNRPSRFALRWGRTGSYELGFVTAERFRELHETTLTDLIPGTVYYYELVGFNQSNTIEQVLSRGQFTTDLPTYTTVPPNVSRLSALVSGESVTLTWKNPELPEGFYVRILRNHLGYPVDIHDGVVVYQGQGESFFDPQALHVHPIQHYSVFVVDGSGAVSSGAILQVVRPGEGIPQSPASSSAPTSSVVPPDILIPTLARELIQIQQDRVQFTFADSSIALKSDRPFSIRIPKDALPPHLKSIIVTLLNPTNHRQSYSFLLRLNHEGTAYETVLAPLNVSGSSQLLIEVYDFETRVVGRYGKHVEFTAHVTASTVVFPDAFVPMTRYWWVLLMLFVGSAILVWYRFWYERRH